MVAKQLLAPIGFNSMEKKKVIGDQQLFGYADFSKLYYFAFSSRNTFRFKNNLS